MLLELETTVGGTGLCSDVTRTTTRQSKVFVIRWRTLHLPGGMPEYFYGFQMLGVLDLSDNALHGPIPNSFASMMSLRRLSLSNNQFTGSVPDSLGACRLLVELYLAFNRADR